jgi:RNA polymerase sigma-70 factor (ECF subfamily)
MNQTDTQLRPPLEAEKLARKRFVIDAFERYERQLTAYALKFYGGRQGDLHAARDAVQHTFLQLCKQPPDQVQDKLAPWLYTVCRNRIFDDLAAKQKRPALGETASGKLKSRTNDPAEQLELDEFLQNLTQLFGSLAENERTVIELWSQGLKPVEIATVLDKQAGSIRVSLHRAITKLRKHPDVSPWLERATGQNLDSDRNAEPDVNLAPNRNSSKAISSTGNQS